MTNPKLQKLRELNEARNAGVKNHFDYAAFMFAEADWLLACVEALEFAEAEIKTRPFSPDLSQILERASAALEGKP